MSAAEWVKTIEHIIHQKERRGQAEKGGMAVRLYSGRDFESPALLWWAKGRARQRRTSGNQAAWL